MFEEKKISKNGKSITLSSGLEISYCEFGEENEEIVLSGAFYFHTFTPVLEELAKRYHVYGVVMRLGGEGTQLNADGSVNWCRQWGDDLYQFCRAMNITRFHYVGKCHGTNPGWYMIKEHPEMLKTFTSFYLAPHLCPRNSQQWVEIPKEIGRLAFLGRCMRKQENIPVKIAEVQTLGPELAAALSAGETGGIGIGQYAESPQLIWDSLEECEEAMKTIHTPVMFAFGTDDILYHDYYDSNLKAMEIVPKARTVLLQGERHLMEMDCPDRMASEVFFFIDESKKNY
ncbi:MAG: alpha/beta fold hydrolase [Anaerovoracaceae bacterium]|jgi:pimeloyl-ACP methyl ester carboxylesterase